MSSFDRNTQTAVRMRIVAAFFTPSSNKQRRKEGRKGGISGLRVARLRDCGIIRFSLHHASVQDSHNKRYRKICTIFIRLFERFNEQRSTMERMQLPKTAGYMKGGRVVKVTGRVMKEEPSTGTDMNVKKG